MSTSSLRNGRDSRNYIFTIDHHHHRAGAPTNTFPAVMHEHGILLGLLLVALVWLLISKKCHAEEHRAQDNLLNLPLHTEFRVCV
jgi:hypothetical protein